MSDKIDKNELLRLVLENKKIIYKVCRSYCNNEHDREELVQEIFVQLWRASGNYDPKYKLSTWMYRISLNVAISFYRKEQRKRKSTVALDERLLESIEVEHEHSESAQDVQHLYQFIGRLDELNKALMLLYLDNHSYKEIAEILGISETNVATKINRIKLKLKQDFSALDN